jgi:superfamily I DNA/RNA helicase
MNLFQRARDEACLVRARLAPALAHTVMSAGDLLGKVEEVLNIAIEQVAPTYSDLGGGSAVLQREQQFIYVSSDVDKWGDEFCGLVAHELGHFFLDDTNTSTTVAHLETLFGSDGSPGVMKVEAYGARERQELQANVFARELLLPRDVARYLAVSGKGPAEIAGQFGIPMEFVRQQMLDALLLPEAPSTTISLNEASDDQMAAAMAEEKAANVVAGPGTGKTTTLIHRVKYLVEVKKIPPSEIIVLTFTNKAAFELVERLRNAGIKDATNIWAGTFHAFGLEFLRKYHQRFGLEADVHVSDQLSSLTMLVAGLSRLNFNYFLRIEDPYEWLGPVVNSITRLKEELVTPKEYERFVNDHPAQDLELQRKRLDVAMLYGLHETMLEEQKSVDFVDLIAKPTIALRDDRRPFSELADRFRHVLVDEYQDVTHAMVEMLRQIAFKKSIWVVGDVRQAIHHWRGASLKSLLKFDTEFKVHADGTNIQRYPLSNNRRSTQEIVDLTQHVGRLHMLEPALPLDGVHAAKGEYGEKPVVFTCSEQDAILGCVVQNISSLRQQGIPYGHQAVLCRWNAEVQKASELLASQGVPVIYIGDLSERVEIKQLLCLVQLLVERRPKALIGLSAIPGLAMPLDDIRLLLKAADENVAYQRGRWLHSPPPGISASAHTVISNLRQLVGNHRHSSNPWSFICDLILEKRFGLPPVADTSVQAWVKRIALWQFAYSVRNGDGEMKEARLSRFLLRQRLRQRVGERQIQRELPPEAAGLDGVRLMNVHGSKGLEFEAVHVAYINADNYGSQKPNWRPEGILDIVPPEVLKSSIEEYEREAAVERNNLLYVAVSRAKRHLFLYQQNKFGDQTLAPQLAHPSPSFNAQRYSGPLLRETKMAATNSFIASTILSYEDFEAYVRCPLSYWYSRILGLKSEADIDVSIRARRALLEALRTFASGTSGSPELLLDAIWTARGLPSAGEDPSLWKDVQHALTRGVTLIKAARNRGGAYYEPSAFVGGITVKMPWGFAIKEDYLLEYAMVRFFRRGISELSTILRPFVPGLNVIGPKKITLNYVLTDTVDEIQGAKRIESTKSYTAAIRFLTGESGPSAGHHCSRCDFSTICPSSPAAAS